MNRSHTRHETRPAATRTLAAFVVGILVGVGLVLPAMPADVEPVTVGEFSTGPVGATLLIGTLLLLAVMTGMWALYQLFVLVERR